jgi:hypothetical protein
MNPNTQDSIAENFSAINSFCGLAFSTMALPLGLA